MSTNLAPGRAAKAYASALVAFCLFVGRGIATGDWTDTEALVAALSTILIPVVVWIVPNDAP